MKMLEVETQLGLVALVAGMVHKGNCMLIIATTKKTTINLFVCPRKLDNFFSFVIRMVITETNHQLPQRTEFKSHEQLCQYE